GKIDVLVNNAALFAPLQETKCTDIDAALWDEVMAVNLRGRFLMAKHVVPHMIAQGYGKIINIGSGTAFRGIPSMLHYVTSKGGIMAFTRALARELGEHGIRVNTLAPGFTLSDTVVSDNPGHVKTARERAGHALPAGDLALHRNQAAGHGIGPADQRRGGGAPRVDPGESRHAWGIQGHQHAIRWRADDPAGRGRPRPPARILRDPIRARRR